MLSCQATHRLSEPCWSMHFPFLVAGAGKLTVLRKIGGDMQTLGIRALASSDHVAGKCSSDDQTA